MNYQEKNKGQQDKHETLGCTLRGNFGTLVIEIGAASLFIATATGNSLGLHFDIAAGAGSIELTIFFRPYLNCDSGKAQTE